MTANSESRKRREAMSDAEAHMVARCVEHRREVVRDCLEAIMSGADFADADCFLDQLSDRGGRVVVGP